MRKYFTRAKRKKRVKFTFLAPSAALENETNPREDEQREEKTQYQNTQGKHNIKILKELSQI